MTPTPPPASAPDDRLNALASAMQSTQSPQVDALLYALLVDEMSRNPAALGLVTTLPEKNPSTEIADEVRAMARLAAHYPDGDQHAALTLALEDLVDRTFRQTAGLPRQRLLAELWAAIPHSMKAYGLLRSAYLDSGFNDILRDYPDEQVPEDDLAAWITLAQAALRVSKADDARHILSILHAQQPDNPFILELLANALIALPDYEAADALYRQLETGFAWPASLIRISDQTIGNYRSDPRWDTPPAHFSWLPWRAAETPPDAPARRIFVVGVDDRYAHRYVPGLLDSLARTYPDGAWLLHVHLVNPAPATLDWIRQLQQAGRPVAATSEQCAERPNETTDTRRIIEMRTFFACARFRVLPELLAHYACPLWVIDADMQAQRPIDTLFAETRQATAPRGLGIVPMESLGRCVYEYIWLSLSYYAATPQTLAFTSALARYINHQLADDHWGWGLDQAAFFAVLAWFERHEPALEVVRLPTACIADSLQNHPAAFFASLVGSMNQHG